MDDMDLSLWFKPVRCPLCGSDKVGSTAAAHAAGPAACYEITTHGTFKVTPVYRDLPAWRISNRKCARCSTELVIVAGRVKFWMDDGCRNYYCSPDHAALGVLSLDWNALVAEMVATGEFHPAGLDALALKRDYEEGRANIETDGTRITAYAAIEDRTFDPKYPLYEIRRVYVADGSENGTAQRLIMKLIKRFTPEEGALPWENPTFFLISKNPKIWHIASKLGFGVVTTFTMPNVREWAKRAGLGKRLPRSATARNPHHSKRRKRWLFKR